MDLSVNYLGFKLKNPIIIGSSGLTNSLDKIIKLEQNNASAIVLKSLFEEQICAEFDRKSQTNEYQYTEAFDYLNSYNQNHSVDEYLQLIEDAKKAVDIPIIASINCVSDSNWISFAKKIEAAGADALELNIAILPSDSKFSSEQNEEIYFKILEKVHRAIAIPIAIKISSYSSGLAKFVQKLDWSQYVKGIVMFNRFYCPDIDINNMKIVPSAVFSTEEEITTSLRWVALLADKTICDIVASTGIHTGEGVIKQLLAGADAVQIVSAIYKHGPEYIKAILEEITTWMKENNFNSIDDFKGRLNSKNIKNPSSFERIQFMKYYGSIE
jgi:dihydroorotate dehydrogenase (fumarate)